MPADVRNVCNAKFWYLEVTQMPETWHTDRVGHVGKSDGAGFFKLATKKFIFEIYQNM